MDEIANNILNSAKKLKELSSSPEKCKFLKAYHLIVQKQTGRESIKLKLATVIYELIMTFGEDFPTEIKVEDANELLSKIEKVVSFRNSLAHDYFKGNKEYERIQEQLPSIAKDCVELNKVLYDNIFDLD